MTNVHLCLWSGLCQYLLSLNQTDSSIVQCSVFSASVHPKSAYLEIRQHQAVSKLHLTVTCSTHRHKTHDQLYNLCQSSIKAVVLLCISVLTEKGAQHTTIKHELFVRLKKNGFSRWICVFRKEFDIVPDRSLNPDYLILIRNHPP